jgi:hypothetical protein
LPPSASRKNPPPRPGASSLSANVAQAKQTMHTMNQVNSTMQQMGVKPSHLASAASVLAPMVPNRPPGGATRGAPVVPRRPPTQKAPTIPSRPNF